MRTETWQQVVNETKEVATAAGWQNARMLEGVIRLPSVVEKIALLHEEISEAIEAYQGSGTASYYEVDGKPEGWGPELADIAIRLADLVGWTGLGVFDEGVAQLRESRTLTPSDSDPVVWLTAMHVNVSRALSVWRKQGPSDEWAYRLAVLAVFIERLAVMGHQDLAHWIEVKQEYNRWRTDVPSRSGGRSI